MHIVKSLMVVDTSNVCGLTSNNPPELGANQLAFRQFGLWVLTPPSDDGGKCTLTTCDMTGPKSSHSRESQVECNGEFKYGPNLLFQYEYENQKNVCAFDNTPKTKYAPTPIQCFHSCEQYGIYQ